MSRASVHRGSLGPSVVPSLQVGPLDHVYSTPCSSQGRGGSILQ
jgi:hypothetical protein